MVIAQLRHLQFNFLYDVSDEQAAKLLAENRYLACPDILVS